MGMLTTSPTCPSQQGCTIIPAQLRANKDLYQRQHVELQGLPQGNLFAFNSRSSCRKAPAHLADVIIRLGSIADKTGVIVDTRLLLPDTGCMLQGAWL